MRFATNTMFGLGGLLDVASEFGMDHQYEDFGQTLGRWGMPAGPLHRVAVARALDRARDAGAAAGPAHGTPAAVVNDGAVRWALSALQLINTRANLLSAARVVDDIALDKYSFVRDAYLARRRSLVYDGEPPDLPEENGTGAAPPAAAAQVNR